MLRELPGTKTNVFACTLQYIDLFLLNTLFLFGHLFDVPLFCRRGGRFYPLKRYFI